MVTVTLVPSQRSMALGGVKAHGTAHSNERFSAQTSWGGVVSLTVTVWLQNAVLPQVSVARQLRVTLNSFGQRGVAALVTVETTSMRTLFKSQPSVAEGMSNDQSVPHWTSLLG